MLHIYLSKVHSELHKFEILFLEMIKINADEIDLSLSVFDSAIIEVSA